MRNSIFVRVIVISLFFSSFAWAKSQSESAKLAELDKNGEPVANLIASVLTASGNSLKLYERYGSPCPPGAMCILGFWERTREFRITRKSRDFCGSLHYRATWSDKKQSATLELVDHKNRVCMDLRKYRWDISLAEVDGTTRYFGGTPGTDPKPPVDCSEIARDKMCTMVFMPATCSASSVNGRKLAEPITAAGGNPCMAQSAIRVAACQKGLDWENLNDDEITCSVQGVTPCPMFMCAAPPAGCQLIPNNQVNENGCPVSCGDIVCSGGPDVAGN